MSTQPPKRALSFLRWFCHKDHIEELEGDLWEVFESQAQQSEKKAARLFFWNVLLHFRPEYIRPLEGNYTLNNYGMYKNYLKIAWRSMLRQKLYSFINIGGLAIGLTCFLLISLYVQHELSYDRFYENAGRIYRVYQRMEGNTYLGSDKIAYTTVGLAPALVTEYPEVDHATTFRDQAALLGYNENISTKEESGQISTFWKCLVILCFAAILLLFWKKIKAWFLLNLLPGRCLGKKIQWEKRFIPK